ncbi:unnamed protein product [Ranitomeya imitator]|uniref:ribonuclease H n=1 Tax=Ranitomeya imitator TaxID=111125 RepID=A0ABN9MCY3_9NEOB|nr:unnamed protein product [Ranitomeya imitator]
MEDLLKHLVQQEQRQQETNRLLMQQVQQSQQQMQLLATAIQGKASAPTPGLADDTHVRKTVPFERIAMDLVGPLVKSARGHQYILVILDYATRYPEAIPLRNSSSKSIARELVHVFSRTGLPKEILTDQGTPFMSKVMRELCKALKISQLRTSVYHPQSDGLVERFNKTLKSMLRKAIEKDGRDWDCLLPYLMFSIREVPQASTGFSPFELLYGRHPRGLLDIAKETWEAEVTPHRSVIEHVALMQQRIAKVMPIVKEHLLQAQEAQARVYNRSARVRQFNPGDRVLVLVPTVESKFLAKWQGPYEVVEKLGEVNYKIHQPGRRKPFQVYHVNLIKPWQDREPTVTPSLLSNPEGEVGAVTIAETLSKTQKQQCRELLQKNRDLFSELPGYTKVIEHEVLTEPHVRVNVKPYRIPEARREVISKEVERMLRLGVIEESKSGWSSPIVLVPKPDGEWRFCNDYRKLNEVSKFDAYPMPRVDELIERLGPARYITTLDLTKGYWQIPMAQEAKEKTAFSTPDGCFQYVRMPFGLQGAPATFQRAMDRVLAPHKAYAAAYLDDIVIFSPDWESHLEKVQAVFDAIREAGFTINPKKCALAPSSASSTLTFRQRAHHVTAPSDLSVSAEDTEDGAAPERGAGGLGSMGIFAAITITLIMGLVLLVLFILVLCLHQHSREKWQEELYSVDNTSSGQHSVNRSRCIDAPMSSKEPSHILYSVWQSQPQCPSVEVTTISRQQGQSILQAPIDRQESHATMEVSTVSRPWNCASLAPTLEVSSDLSTIGSEEEYEESSVSHSPIYSVHSGYLV